MPDSCVNGSFKLSIWLVVVMEVIHAVAAPIYVSV